MSKETVNIHGKEYETVASRVSRFRETHKTFGIVTKIVSNDENVIVMKAAIKDENERVMATGYAEEVRGKGNINQTSALENCETSAIGRALAAFGYTGSEYASADEVANAVSQQDDGTIKFGKHKGKKWEDIPEDYLQWMLTADKINDDMKQKADQELTSRQDAQIDLNEDPFGGES